MGYPTRMQQLRKRFLFLVLVSIGFGLTGACSRHDFVRIASSTKPADTAASLARARAAGYQANPLQLANDLQQARTNYRKLLEILAGKAGRQWGEKGVVTPTSHRYVKYTQNYLSRAIVEFDEGLVTVETLDVAKPDESLKNAIVTTLLTPDDPRAVDLYSDSNIALGGTPYLLGLVVDESRQVIDSPARAERYAGYLLRSVRQVRTTDTGEGRKRVHYVQIRMVNDYVNRQAQRYLGLAEKHGKKFAVSKSLILAVMKTESSFNPFAVSSAPAYGLMQLVPSSGGRDAYEMVKGYAHTPSKEYLFDANNNIELGTAYLNILDRRYLVAITDPLSREYCTIAAYNGGAGSVLNMFSGDRARAASIINSLAPAEVYQRLRNRHPSAETRRYLFKVLEARKEFVNI